MADTAQTVCWSIGSPGEKSGHLWWPSGSERPEQVLWDSIRRLRLEEQIRATFQVTRPLFYGLWIDTPLSAHQLSLLLAVFEDVVHQTPRLHRHLDEFIQVMRQSRERGQTVNVCLSPPGHVDMGWITTFVHCPKCKAEGPFERWQPSYPAETIQCPVCGHAYSPAATHRSEEELFTETVQCRDCKRTFPVRGFPRADIQTLELSHRYRELCDELSWMDRVEAFYQKYPELDGIIKPDLFPLSDIRDPVVRQQLADGVPISELPAPPPPSPLTEFMESMAEEELEVINYLKHHYFSLRNRKPFVESALRDIAPKLEQGQVRCSRCGGELQ